MFDLPIIQLDFVIRNGHTFKRNAVYLKKARGMMLNYLIEHHIEDIEQIKEIVIDDYHFSENDSNDNHWVFIKDEKMKYIKNRRLFIMYKVGVLGAGTWGMAVARVLCNRHHSVMVWSALPQEIEYIQKNRTHPKLPELEIPDDMEFTTDIKEVCNSEYLVVAVPSIFMRSTMETAKDYIKDQILIDLAKGVEKDSLYTMSEIIRDVLGNQAKIVALSGPTHAEEVVRDMPSTIVSACDDLEVAEKVQNLFQDTCMRVYTNIDVRGVELCGALKNIIALAAGISHGLNYGDNTRAALITRGLSEMTRLGTTMGCLEQTFHGLAGIGDLIVTATSVHSRNFKCGTLIGQGYNVDDATKEVGMVVEGLNALPAANATC